jgi:hypothetical protein
VKQRARRLDQTVRSAGNWRALDRQRHPARENPAGKVRRTDGMGRRLKASFKLANFHRESKIVAPAYFDIVRPPN